MNEFIHWHQDILGQKTAEALQKNHFAAQYFSTRDEAITHIRGLITAGSTVGIAGSSTIKELGLDQALEADGYTVYNHNKPGLTPAESLATRKKEMMSDVFLTGTNAVTLDGKLVNVDGAGNRVAAMLFGPGKVIIIAGINKVVADVDAAERRIEQFAAPMNCKRLNRKTPCVQTGQCMDCQSPERICNITTIMRKRPAATDVHVVIIGEQLGY